MTEHRDPERLIHAFLLEGAERLHDRVYDAVRADIDHRRQRTVIGPWRVHTLNKIVPIGLGAAAVVVALVIGAQFLGPAAPSGVGGAPSTEPTATPSPPPIGGTVKFQDDGAPVTTVVTAIADGASVSGTAVTTFVGGTHTTRVECAVRDGDRWAFGGTTEQTTLPDERTGDWSAVIVQDGSPQQIGVLLSIAKAGESCDAFFESLADFDVSSPVESGALVPPPDLAP